MQKLKQIGQTVKDTGGGFSLDTSSEISSQNPSSIRSRNQIIAALFDLAKREPIAKISISQICAHAGITRPTFYHHFKTKEDVFVYVLDELFAEFVADVGHGDGGADLHNIVRSFIGFWAQQKHFLRIARTSNLFGLMGARFKDYLDEVYELRFASRLGHNEQRYHNAFLASGLAAILLEWTAHDFEESEEELAGYIASLFESLYAGELE